MLDLIRFDPFKVGFPWRDSRGWLFGPSIFSRLVDENGFINPKVDITEGESDYKVTAEIPGLTPEDVKVEIEGGFLRLSAQKVEEKEEEKDNYHLKERRSGSFCRTFKLPDNVDGEKVEATVKDGLLTVTFQKVEAEKPKQIEIKVH